MNKLSLCANLVLKFKVQDFKIKKPILNLGSNYLFWSFEAKLTIHHTRLNKHQALLTHINIISTRARNHVKLGICSKVTVLCGGCWLWAGRSLRDCRPALLKGRKYQMVKTQTESHDRRPIDWTNRWQIWDSFSFEVCRGTAGIYHPDPWGFSKAL